MRLFGVRRLHHVHLNAAFCLLGTAAVFWALGLFLVLLASGVFNMNYSPLETWRRMQALF